MRTAFHDKLDGLTVVVGDMCGLAGEAMAKATQALLQADLVLAEQVITDHDQLARMKAGVEESAFVLLALQAPVAGDLRAVVTRCRTWPTPSAWVDWRCTSARSPDVAIRATRCPKK